MNSWSGVTGESGWIVPPALLPNTDIPGKSQAENLDNDGQIPCNGMGLGSRAYHLGTESKGGRGPTQEQADPGREERLFPCAV